MAELQPIIVPHGRHFFRHLAICNLTCVKLLQLMCAAIAQNSVKKRCLLINGWVTANYSVSRPPFCPPSWNLYSDLCQTLTGYVRCYSTQYKIKTTSLSQTVFLRFTNAAYTHTDTQRETDTHTHTHTHNDSIKRNAMRCISPKNCCCYNNNIIMSQE